MNSDKLKILKEIGKGSIGLVFKAVNEDGQYFAVKILDYNSQENVACLENEWNALSKIKHPNILQVYAISKNSSIFILEKEACTYILMEYAAEGSLKSYYSLENPFSEELARYYFKQLISAVEHCHKHKLIHKDVKPENILLDSFFNLKLSDFDIAAQNNWKDLLKNFSGTKGYFPPEILLGKEGFGEAVDLFACGVVLINLTTGVIPFAMAHQSDPVYVHICCNNYFKFWEIIQSKTCKIISSELKELINSLVSVKPAKRMKVEQIKEHSWWKMKDLTQEEAINEMKKRKKEFQIET